MMGRLLGYLFTFYFIFIFVFTGTIFIFIFGPKPLADPILSALFTAIVINLFLLPFYILIFIKIKSHKRRKRKLEKAIQIHPIEGILICPICKSNVNNEIGICPVCNRKI